VNSNNVAIQSVTMDPNVDFSKMTSSSALIYSPTNKNITYMLKTSAVSPGSCFVFNNS